MKIEDSFFNDVRENFNEVLNSTFLDMDEKKCDDGEVVLKIKIKYDRIKVPCKDGVKLVIRPKFVHSCSSSISSKIKLKGNLNDEKQLEIDSEKNIFLSDLSGNQLSVF